jgi:hypothetical protein
MNNDVKNLEEAYDGILSEMAYRPTMPKYSVRPRDVESGDYLKKAASSYIQKLSPEEREKQIKVFFNQIERGLDILKNDHDNVNVARSILGIINNFPNTYDDFEINGNKMSYADIVNELLKLTTTATNDPDRIKIYFDPTTEREIAGQTIDQYLATPGSTREHYYLFRELLAALPEQEVEKRPGAVTKGVAKERSTREKRLLDIPEGERRSVEIYFKAERLDVLLDDKHIGWYNPNVVFYPNELGKEMSLYEEDEKSIKRYGYVLRPRAWSKFYKNNKDKLKFENKVVLPYRCSTFPEENGTYKNPPFWWTNARIPRTPEEPNITPAPLPFTKHSPEELGGLHISEVRFIVGSKGAEEEFKNEFPTESFPSLYKHGKTPGVINAKRAADTSSDEAVKEAFKLILNKEVIL